MAARHTLTYLFCLCILPQVLIIGDEEYPPYMRPPLSKELWYCDDEELVSDLKFKQWNGKERGWDYLGTTICVKMWKLVLLNGARNYFLIGAVFDFSCSIFFEPEVFFSKPGELPTKESGGVALLKGKKVTVKIVC